MSTDNGECVAEAAGIAAFRSVKLLYANYFVAGKGDEGGARRRRAVDPVFSFGAVGVALTDFMLRTAQGGKNHFVIHAFQRFMIGDGLLELRGKSVDPVDGAGVFLGKIEESLEVGHHVVGAHIRNVAAEVENQSAADGLLLGYFGRGSGRRAAGASHADLDVVAQVEMTFAATVYLDDDFLGMKFDGSDLHGVAGNRGGRMAVQSVL